MFSFHETRVINPVIVRSSPDQNLSGSRDALHSDEEAGSPHAHPAGPDGVKGRRASRKPIADAEIGESEVSLTLLKKRKDLPGVDCCMNDVLVFQAFQGRAD